MSLALDVPLLPPACHSYEDHVRAHLAVLIQSARDALGSQLLAVVLGGSLARGEGVVLASKEKAKLLSDIDLYLVLKKPDSQKTGTLESSLREQAAEDAFFAAPLDLGFVEESWFRRLKSTIPAHQLAFGHRVLYDQTGGFEVEIPAVRSSDRPRIDRDDALRLLMNRYAEQILLEARQPHSDFTHYHRWKLCLDAPLSWLAMTGHYDPRRMVQREHLAQLKGTRNFGEWLTTGLEKLESIQAAIQSGPLDPQLLQGLQGSELEWSWPFFRAGLQLASGTEESAHERGLENAVAEGAPGRSDLERGIRWLQRRPLLARLREARRWARVGPTNASSWITHARGGAGRDRVQLACALYYAGLQGWVEVLRDLIADDELMQHSGRADLGNWLGGLWSDWVMGGSRS